MSDTQEIIETMREHFFRPPAQRLERSGNVWRVTPNNEFLVCTEPRAREYEVPVAQLNDKREFCDWLAHLLEKNWCTDKVIADFVKAADMLVGLQ